MTNPTADDVLKPCPFCGSPAEVKSYNAVWVACTECWATEGRRWRTNEKSEAIAAWNTRTNPPPVAWMYTKEGHPKSPILLDYDTPAAIEDGWTETPLYTRTNPPPASDWKAPDPIKGEHYTGYLSRVMQSLEDYTNPPPVAEVVEPPCPREDSFTLAAEEIIRSFGGSVVNDIALVTAAIRRGAEIGAEQERSKLINFLTIGEP